MVWWWAAGTTASSPPPTSPSGGPRVALPEARHKVGGADDTSNPFPDYPEVSVTTLSYVMSLMPPEIV
jgi:hypothetical protein